VPTLEDLNIRSEWVGHEFRVLARSYGWLVKKVGVESLFANRKGALQYLQYQFTPVTLLLRSQPDMLLRGNSGVEMFEAKAVEDAWDNVAIEAWQLIYLYTLYRSLGVDTNYVFGWPQHEVLDGVIVPVSLLPLTRFYKPPRFRQWPNQLRDSLERLVKHYYPDIEIRGLAEGHRGSGDPYFVFTKSNLSQFQTISHWFVERGQQFFGMKDRISWEGQKEANEVWKSWKYSDWIRVHEKRRPV